MNSAKVERVLFATEVFWVIYNSDFPLCPASFLQQQWLMLMDILLVIIIIIIIIISSNPL